MPRPLRLHISTRRDPLLRIECDAILVATQLGCYKAAIDSFTTGNRWQVQLMLSLLHLHPARRFPKAPYFHW